MTKPKTQLGKDIAELVAALEKVVTAGQEIKAKLEELNKRKER